MSIATDSLPLWLPLSRSSTATSTRREADPTEDKVGYRQIPLWLSQEELAELIIQIRSILLSRMDNQPAPGRRLHLLSPIVFPIGKTQATPD